MKIYIVDISGRVVNYDLALYDSIMNNCRGAEINLLLADVPKENHTKGILHLFRLIPSKYKCKENIWKRLLKALEGTINYFYLLLLCLINKPNIIHFQWLPFTEFCSLEIPLLKVLKLISSRSKLILTIHNVFPHNYSDLQREQYKKRFVKIASLFNCFVVHTIDSKKEVINNFSIREDLIKIVHHGIFIPDLTGVKEETHHSNYRIISYGNQDYYKGTDILLDAINQLPKEYKDRIEISIIGRGAPSFIDVLKKKGEGLNIMWRLYFVDDTTLYQEICNSDAIILPYRNISQSGVLLLALSFDKPIICSDLPAFVETLDNYPSELFFQSGDPSSLKDVIIHQLTNGIDNSAIKSANSLLRKKYSWVEAGRRTFEIYTDILI